MEQAAQAMAVIGASAGMGASLDEGQAPLAEAMVEADALADLEMEERLQKDEMED